MCVASMIGDHYRDKWTAPGNFGFNPPVQDADAAFVFRLSVPPVSKADFNDLKRDVEEMKALLKRAVKYDVENGEPTCEMDEKMDLLRRVAKMVGISLDDVIPPKPTGPSFTVGMSDDGIG